MNKLLLLVLLLLCAACSQNTSTSSELIDYIPRKASAVIKTQDIEQLTTSLANQAFLKKFKDTPFADFFQTQKTLFSNVKSDGEALICYTKIGNDSYDYSVIMSSQRTTFQVDSTQYNIKQLSGTTPPITSIQSQDNTVFSLEINGVLIVSSSQLLLENTLREQDNENISIDDSFLKIYQAASNQVDASVLLKGSEAPMLWNDLFPKSTNNPLQDTFEWALLDIELSQQDIEASGVTIVASESEQRFRLLQGTQPQPNRLDEVTPLTAQKATSITYDNWEQLKTNIADFRKIDPLKFSLDHEAILSTFTEIGLISLSETDVLFATTYNPEETNTALEGLRTATTTFRQVPLYTVDLNDAFAKAYKPLISLPQAKVYCELDGLYLFAENQKALEIIIANYQNKATLAHSKAFQNTKSQLSSASSFLFIEPIENIDYGTLFSGEDSKQLQKIDLSSYPFLAIQLIQDTNFLHLNTVWNQNEKATEDGTIAQVASVELSSPIAVSPQLVKNHRTKGMDVVVQDIENNLYLISNAGKVLWQKKLDATILGDVQQVDLYRNGRLQLAFATANNFYIIDRNGNDVAPFPIKLNEEITQPVAIFDYENNRNYRFILTQGENILMYDKQAKRVNGFTFTRAGSDVVMPPQHIRIGNKDYITVAENSGKLHILNRTGKSRIDVEERIDFGETKLFKENNQFTTYDVNGNKIAINTKGGFSQTPTALGSNFLMNLHKGKTISIKENMLRINQKEVELPYGTYSSPYLFNAGKKNYATVTNLETQQVYIFNENAQLLENFPIYGTTQSSIGLLERLKSLGFVTQGDEKTILIYKIQE